MPSKRCHNNMQDEAGCNTAAVPLAERVEWKGWKGKDGREKAEGKGWKGDCERE